MPKRDVQVIAHSALTNHRIVRTPGQPLPDAAFPNDDLLHINKSSGEPLPRLTLLQAYGQLADRYPPYNERFQMLLDECAKKDADHPLVLASLGRRALRTNSLSDAIQYLKRSLERGSVSSTTYEDLGEALARSGQLEESAGVLQRGIELAPYTQVLYKSLALRYIKLQRFDDARKTLTRYVELFPEDDFVRNLLAQVSGPR
jgi:tetratricopeptide (TPR) repeat protein